MIKKWYNNEYTNKKVKTFFIAVIILFIIGLVMKLVDTGTATHAFIDYKTRSGNYHDDYFALKQQAHVPNEFQTIIEGVWKSPTDRGSLTELQTQLNTNPALSHLPAPLVEGLWKNWDGYKRLDNAWKDQVVGVSVGWILIALKLVIYSISIIKLFKITTKGAPYSAGTFKSLFIKYVILFTGLLIGEIITIYMTLRNDPELSTRILYSFISPAMSVVASLMLAIYAYHIWNYEKELLQKKPAK